MDDIVRAEALWGYRQLVGSLGGDADALLAEVGLSASDLDNFDAYVSRPAVIALYEKTAVALRCPDFGMRLAAMQDVNILGALAFAVRNAANLRDAARVLSLYLHFHAPVPTLTLEEHEGPLRRLVGRSGHAPDTPSHQYVEHAFCLLAHAVRTLTGGQARVRQVLFMHAAGTAPAVYRRHFGVLPDFDQEQNALVLTELDLECPFTQANRPLQALVEHYLDAHSPASGRSVDQQVRHTLARLMRVAPATTINDVADVLRTHPRTLQRKLQLRGLTFEQLRDEVRRTLAEVYLAHGAIPIAHVAELLGYADQSVFTRSCLRWFGKTPLAMRKELTERENGK